MSVHRPQPAIFLDRDGVLNRIILRNGLAYAPDTLEQLEIAPDVPDALRRLKQAGFALIAVTNQPDVARGLQTRDMVEAINRELSVRLPIDEFRVCYHDDRDQCSCRKPLPGLLLQEPVYNVGESFMVGDRWRDIEAGKAAKVKGTILIESGHNEQNTSAPDFRARTLAEAADWILNASNMRTS